MSNNTNNEVTRFINTSYETDNTNGHFRRGANALSATNKGVLRHALCIARNELKQELLAGESIVRSIHRDKEANAARLALYDVNDRLLDHVEPRLPALRYTLEKLDLIERLLFGHDTPASPGKTWNLSRGVGAVARVDSNALPHCSACGHVFGREEVNADPRQVSLDVTTNALRCDTCNP